MKHPRTSSHNYLSKIEAFTERLDKYGPSVSEVDILHDDWCDIYHDWFCNCDPTIKVISCEIVSPKN